VGARKRDIMLGKDLQKSIGTKEGKFLFAQRCQRIQAL
jgi:hypothetical protein